MYGISIIKIRRLWDCITYNENSYTDKRASLYWNGPQESGAQGIQVVLEKATTDQMLWLFIFVMTGCVTRLRYRMGHLSPKFGTSGGVDHFIEHY